MDNEENNSLDATQKKPKREKRRGYNPLRNIQNKAKQVQNASETGQKILNDQAQKKIQKAMEQTNKKAASTLAKATKYSKRAEKLGKVASQASKVGKIAAKLGKYISTIGFIILIIIVIIGLLVFIITGLGLIMSGLEKISAAFFDAAFNFLNSSAENVNDEEILDTLSYLEEMDYDLYGYGFSALPNPITEVDDGNGGKQKALAYPGRINPNRRKAYKYIIAYLISDNYANVARHQEVTISTLFGENGNGLIGIYHEYSGELGHVNTNDAYGRLEAGSIKIKDGKLVVSETQVFARKVFEYDLDGWTGRYSMPLEFLLSVHLATMAPDLSYKLATEFDTEVQIGLHTVSGDIDSAIGPSAPTVTWNDVSSVNNTFFGNDWRMSPEEAYELFSNHDGVIESYTGDDVPQYKCMGPPSFSSIGSQTNSLDAAGIVQTGGDLKEEVQNQVNGLVSDEKINISQEELNKIIEAIEKCITNEDSSMAVVNLLKGRTAQTKRFAAPSSNVTLQYNGEEGNNIIFKIGNETFKVEKYISDKDVIPGSDEAKERIVDEILKQIEKKGLDKNSANNINQVNSIVALVLADSASANSTSVTLEGTINPDNDNNNGDNNSNDNNNADNDNNNNDGTSNPDSVQISNTTKSFYTNGTYDGKGATFQFSVTLIANQDGTKQWEIELLYDIPEDNGGAIHCSDPCPQDGGEYHINETEKACANCVKYLSDIYKSLKETKDGDFNTYLPYVYRVKDHWFREVYFTHYAIEDAKREAGGDITIIANDDDYEKKTGERWTLYETDDDGEYKLYAYFKNGNNYDPTLTDVVCKKVEKGEGKYKLSSDGTTYVKAENGEGEYKLEPNRNVDEFRVGKKAVNDTEITNEYMAYKFNDVGNPNWQQLTPDENSPQAMQDVVKAGLTLYYKTGFGSVQQVEDGVRGETKAKIKQLFLDDYYLYDGTKGTAALIQKAKETASSSDPDDYRRGNFGEIKATYEEPEKDKDGNLTGNMIREKYTATIDQISGPISLAHSSLTAFSMLENMHTLDSEFIYRDFKELIVELNYFDKEDLVDPEDEVMMFPIAGLSAAGWPVTRYDKSEFYGTLIHSAEDLKALKAKTINELMELLGEEEIPDDLSPEEQTPDNTADNQTQPVTSDNPLVLAAKDIYDYVAQDGGYHYSQPQRASTFEASKTNKYYDCSSYVSWCLQLVGIFSEGELTNSRDINTISKLADYYHSGAPATLETGMIIIYQGHVNIYVGNGMYYDGGEDGGIKYKTYNKTIKGYISIPSNKMTYSAKFEGFEEGTAVVAPVTGEVKAYGTVKRKNIETGEEDTEVGFIKIRVLGTTECKTTKPECEYFVNDHHKVNNISEDDTPTDWLESKYSEQQLEKLGYDYFWEEYRDAGLGEHVVYIEGFDVSDIETLTGETVSGEGKANIETLKKYIKSLEESPDGEIKNSYTSQYVIPNLLDDTREFELKVAKEAKERAVYTMKKDGKIYIKEGAVIGKTFSADSPIVKELEIEGEEQSSETYKVGNYLKLILRDEKDELVENIEDYIEIPKPGGTSTPVGNQQYQFTPEDLDLLAKVIQKECCANGQIPHLGSEERAALAAKATGYCLINRALTNFGGHGTTISEQYHVDGQYADHETVDTTNPCEKCIIAAQWCYENDCSSITNSQGIQMTTDVVYQGASETNGSALWEHFETRENPTNIRYK